MTNRVAMISGANRGIGEAIAAKLYQSGFKLSLGVRDPSAAQHLLEAYGTNCCILYSYDARTDGADKAWVDATLQAFGRIDALVNNAGIYGSVEFPAIDFDEVDNLLQVNAKAVLSVSQSAFEYLRETKGRIL